MPPLNDGDDFARCLRSPEREGHHLGFDVHLLPTNRDARPLPLRGPLCGPCKCCYIIPEWRPRLIGGLWQMNSSLEVEKISSSHYGRMANALSHADGATAVTAAG